MKVIVKVNPVSGLSNQYLLKRKLMIRNDIHAGHVITLSNGMTYTVIAVPAGRYLMPNGSHVALTPIIDICNEDLTPKIGMSAIIEIRSNGKVIWSKPVEMTIAEIEKALRMKPGSLRIKK
jgi:hypothetical protein